MSKFYSMLAYSIRSEVSIILVIDADIAKLISLLVHPSLYHSVCLLVLGIGSLSQSRKKTYSNVQPYCADNDSKWRGILRNALAYTVCILVNASWYWYKNSLYQLLY